MSAQESWTDRQERPVPGNDWTRVDVPAIGQWTPAQPISVVIPAFQSQSALDLTLAALANQTYPLDLLDVIIVDDGSEPPIHLASAPGRLKVEILRQERCGFGAGRARARGMAHARGTMILFLDSDMLLEPHAVEAHARWHHVMQDAVVLGSRVHVDTTGLAPSDVDDVRTAEDFADLIADRERWAVEWIEKWLRRTSNLTENRHDVFRITTSGNLSVRSDFAHAVGGFRSFGMRGIEDTEFGYRLGMAGAVFVPDHEARAWHQGPSFFQREDSEDAKARREAALRDSIALTAFRPVQPGRCYTLPSVNVRFEEAASVAAAVSSVNAVLASSWHDLIVDVAAPDEHVRRVLVETFLGDARVNVADSLPESSTAPSPVHITVPCGVLVGADTVKTIVDVLDQGGFGAVHVTVPGLKPVDGLIEAEHRRAISRVRRFERDPQRRAALVGELFGERWLAGSELGVRLHGAPLESLDESSGAGTHIDQGSSRRPCRDPSYLGMIEILAANVERHLPGDAIVAVVARGDDQLLVGALRDRRGGHFPQTPQGVWLGYHLESGPEVVAQLDELRRTGYTHLLVPETCRWWLDHYSELTRYVEGRTVFDISGAGALFALPEIAVPAPRVAVGVKRSLRSISRLARLPLA